MTVLRPAYDVSQSPLYELRAKAKLARLLYTTPGVLGQVIKAPAYRQWETPPKYPQSTHAALEHKPRWIEEPLGAVREYQERLNRLLARIAVPDYLQSARKGRSYRTNAEAHRGPGGGFRIDIKKFYRNAHSSKVCSFFEHRMKCSPDVARVLTKIACFEQHLPTGSPLSPLISFMAYWPMFDELNSLAAGLRLSFTVYVDDIVMSGAAANGALLPECKRIVKSYGLRAHKIALFGAHDARIVTGVAIEGGAMSIPKKRHRTIRALHWELNKATDPFEVERYRKALVGQYREGAPLDATFKQQADRLT